MTEPRDTDTSLMEELRESEARFRQLAENIDEVFWLRDARTDRMLYVNPAYDDIWGRNAAELFTEGLSWLDSVHPEDRAAVEAALPRQPEGSYDMRYRVVRPDGSIRWVRDRCVPVRDASGEVIRLAGVAEDITRFVAADAAVRESEERLRQITEHLNVGVWIYTADFSETLYVNEQAAVLWDAPLEVAYDRPLAFLDRVHPEDRWLLELAMAQLEPVEIFVRVLLASGERVFCIRGHPVRRADGSVYRIVGITEDVTDRIRAERELHESEAHYRRLVETSPYAIYALDVEGRFTEANPAAEQVLGRTADDLIGAHFGEVVHPDDMAMGMAIFGRLLSGEERRADLILRVVPPGGEPRWLSIAVAAVRDETGAVGAHGIARDITEERVREQHLRRTERYATMFTLIGGVAHELNNPLQAIAGFADLLLADGEREGEEADALRTIAREARRATRIVTDLRLLARQTHEETERREPVDLNEIVRHVLHTRRYTHSTANIVVREDLGHDLGTVMGDAGRLEQVLINLVVNAEHALGTMPGDRLLVVRTRPTARGVGLSVYDNGPGIPADALPRLFDPFWTTKAPGEGTGLGLSLVHSIVQDHGGTVHVESETGRGALFMVELPAVHAHAEPVEAPQPLLTQAPAESPRRVLVVDDEAAIRRLVVQVARRRGHEAEEVTDGTAALRRIDEAEAEGRPFDVVVSDLRMPGLDGSQLLESLVARDASWVNRLVILTGDPTELDPERLGQERVRIAAKPIGVNELVKLIEE